MATSTVPTYKNMGENIEAVRKSLTPSVDAIVAEAIKKNPPIKQSYTVLINNRPISREYTVIGSPEYAKTIANNFDRMLKTEEGQVALKQYAQKSDKLLVVAGDKGSYASAVKDPLDTKTEYNKRTNATVITFNPKKYVDVKFNDVDKPNDTSNSTLQTPENKFTHEFGHALQHAGIFPPHYSIMKNDGSKPHSQYSKMRERQAIKWSNDIDIALGSNQFRKRHGGPGSPQVDSKDQLITRQEENIIPYKQLKNKIEYLTKDQIFKLNTKNGTNYSIKADAQGTFVRAEIPSGEYANRRLYHFSDIDQKGSGKSRSPTEVKQDFADRNKEIVNEVKANKEMNSTKNMAQKESNEIGL